MPRHRLIAFIHSHTCFQRNNRKKKHPRFKPIATTPHTTGFYPAVDQSRSFPHCGNAPFDSPRRDAFASSFSLSSPLNSTHFAFEGAGRNQGQPLPKCPTLLSSNNTIVATIPTLHQEEARSIDFSAQAPHLQRNPGKRNEFNPPSFAPSGRIATDTSRPLSRSSPQHFNFDPSTAASHSLPAPSGTPEVIFGRLSRFQDDCMPSTKGQVERYDPNAFSFTAALGTLEKTATQPPSQVEVALVLDCVNACR